ncbi:unnamed protein product [Lactuca virosa]|uniref:Uncharacterized protein n=1 Tax=Lactuca virosa TaxID=75947 RepID=A0AAU9N7X0_9ASTR|nr:unnamed protein product [Lactuca virosa]
MQVKGGARHTVSKVGKKNMCSVCKQVGHNKVTCSQAEKPTKLRVKKRKRADGNVGERSSGKKEKDGKDEQGRKGNKGINGNFGEGSSGKKAKHVTDEQGSKGNKGINGSVGEGSSCKKAMDGKYEKKLATRVEGKNREGNTIDKPMELE